MAKNKGKDFENIIRDAFSKITNVSIDRIPDQTMHHKGACNICDFIVYKEPHEYYIECKTVKGNTLPFSNITDTQWEGLLKKSKIEGVFAGVICWWTEKDVTLFIPIQTLNIWKTQVQLKSIRYDIWEKDFDVIKINGKKKRIYFDYDIEEFFKTIERRET